uniref:Si:ch73-335m24.2 n=1 Tax=Salmo trutta TaxID=8032 RepID=A0A673WAU6_SALTR
ALLRLLHHTVCVGLSLISMHTICYFSVYLHTILRNHTAHACDGDTLSIKCPSRTSVSVMSAFYGRRVPSKNLCPPANTNMTEDNTGYVVVLSLQKVVSECQDRRSCHIPVISPVFGQDPCPLTSKYLIVSYKCQHHRTRLVCENERLRLVCKNNTVLAIYSATFGHLCRIWQDSTNRSGTKPTNCNYLDCIAVNIGLVFYLFLIEQYHASFTPDLCIIPPPTGLPERVALYFVSGICAGLVFLLCLFGLRSTVVRDIKNLATELGDELKASRRPRREVMEDQYDDDTSDASSFRRLTQSYRAADIFSPATMTVEMVEREGEEKEMPNSTCFWLVGFNKRNNFLPRSFGKSSNQMFL